MNVIQYPLSRIIGYLLYGAYSQGWKFTQLKNDSFVTYRYFRGRHERYPGIHGYRFKILNNDRVPKKCQKMGTGYRKNFTTLVPLDTRYRQDKNFLVPKGPGYWRDKKLCVPMGTGYRPNFKSCRPLVTYN